MQWAEALGVFQQAADWIGLESRKSLWGQFWSAHQRFFKYLCVAAKVHRLVELAREELARDKVSKDCVKTPHPCAGGRWQSLAPHVRISVSGSKRSLCVSGRPPPMGESGDAGPSPAHSQLPVAGGKQGLAPGSPCPGRAGESPDSMGQGQAEKSRGSRS